MSHGEKRTVWWKEGLLAVFTGGIFGATNTIVGHPFDTIKTKMQAQSQHMGARVGYITTIRNIQANEGLTVLYRGALAAGIGSIVYRATGFSVYELFYTKWENNEKLRQPIPFSGGIEWRTFAAGWMSGSFRAFLECPFEYAKVRRQTGQSWELSKIYKGFPNVYPRAVGIMGGYFMQLDSWRRHTKVMDSFWGKFCASGSAAMFCYWVIWPFEVLKNLAQAGTKEVGNNSLQRAKFVMKTYGLKGFYRGLLPGSQSVFLRNGASFIMLDFANR
jgi:solute carrier family 25 carnitine/acylcarnitine transporter 20/29